METVFVGYRDEQLALRLKAEAAEERAAEAERRRLAAQAEIDRLRMELAYARAAPPDLGLMAAKRASLVFLGGLAMFVVLVSSTVALRAIPCPGGARAAPTMTLSSAPPLVPLEPREPAASPDLHLMEDAQLEMHPEARCPFVLRSFEQGSPYALPALAGDAQTKR